MRAKSKTVKSKKSKPSKKIVKEAGMKEITAYILSQDKFTLHQIKAQFPEKAPHILRRAVKNLMSNGSIEGKTITCTLKVVHKKKESKPPNTKKPCKKVSTTKKTAKSKDTRSSTKKTTRRTAKDAKKPNIRNSMPAETGYDSKNLFGQKEISHCDFKEAVRKVTDGASNPLDDEEMEKLFKICDGNNDGILTNRELKEAYEWLRPLAEPVSALINVDVQNDFINGSLALPQAEEVVPVINELIEKRKFDLLVYSKDWHPRDHISFIENVKMRKLAPNSSIQDPEKVKVYDTVIFLTNDYGPVEQKIWPTHCVQGTFGASFHKDLEIPEDSEIVEKGYKPDVESYTAFGTPKYSSPTILQSLLKRNKITELYLTGLALDVCVGNTGLDALDLGYTVTMVEDAQRGVGPESNREMKKRVEDAGGNYRQSSEVIAGEGITLDDRMATLRRKLSREIPATQINT